MDKIVNEKGVLSESVGRLLYVITLALICVFFAVGVLLAVIFDIPQESVRFANVLTSLIGLLFSAILYASCMSSGIKGKKRDFLFCSILFLISVDFFLMVLSAVLSENDKFGVFILIIHSAYYIVGVAYWVVLSVYILDFLPAKKIYRKILICVGVFCGLYTVSIIVNAFYPIYFCVKDGVVVYLKNDVLSVAFSLIWSIVLFTVIFMSEIKNSLKYALICFTVFPIISGIINLILAISGVELKAELSGVFALIPAYIIFISLYLEQKTQLERQKTELERQKADNTEYKTELMLSQIQPHFIYNALATISGLSREEGAMKTREAVNKFADYLRVNIDSIRTHQLVPFEKELEHVKTYLWLEQMRFGDDIKIEYDIEFSNFELPTLTIQPLVENAVKHGICKRENGGTVKISTRINDKSDVVITVSDDGVGFDTEKTPSGDRTHVGIHNIRTRLEALKKGELTIESEVGKGTVATLTIFGGENTDEYSRS